MVDTCGFTNYMGQIISIPVVAPKARKVPNLIQTKSVIGQLAKYSNTIGLLHVGGVFGCGNT